MAESRKYPRHECNIPVHFEYHEGDPDSIDMEESIPLKSNGRLMDWSRGGAMIVSKARVCVGLPISLTFKIKRKKNTLRGLIVRTGLILNNPSEAARRMKKEKVKGDAYIGIKFDHIIDSLEV